MSAELKALSETVERIGKVLALVKAAKDAPAAARKDLADAIVGHNNWDGYGLREVRGKELHERAVAAVTDYLVNDLADRKRIELRAFADELDALRGALADQAAALRFALCDDVRAAREWCP